jgi:hypothetical protein
MGPGVSFPPAAPPPTGRRALPLAVYGVALAAALLHVVPLATGWLTTPDGWRFTGIHQLSEDVMTYRQWFRQAQLDGPVIRNMLTSEPDESYVLVVFAWMIGTLAKWTGSSPEWVYALSGCVFAFLFVLVLHRLVAAFVPWPAARWWILGATLVGGGLSGHLKLLLRVDSIRSQPLVRRLIVEPLQTYNLWEDYRGQFVFQTLFDSHFLIALLCTSASVLAAYRYLSHPAPSRLLLAAALAAVTSVVHLYSGLTLIAIFAGIAWTCWIGGLGVRPAVIVLLVVGASAAAGVSLSALAVGSQGLEAPQWRAAPMLPSLLLLSYTLQLGMAAWALPRLWRDRTLETCVLAGWLAGCLALTSSGPFNPYPDRGTMTMLIPATVLGGLGYFTTRTVPSTTAILVGAFFLLATPLWTLAHEVDGNRFTPSMPAKFMSAAHDDIVTAVRSRARPDDVLLSDGLSLLWLAPYYPGTHYCAHFFMTADYARKNDEVSRFFAATAAEQAAFLRAERVRYVFATARRAPALSTVPGLQRVIGNDVGTLFAFAPR